MAAMVAEVTRGQLNQTASNSLFGRNETGSAIHQLMSDL
jgi:hypothetical protein